MTPTLVVMVLMENGPSPLADELGCPVMLSRQADSASKPALLLNGTGGQKNGRDPRHRFGPPRHQGSANQSELNRTQSSDGVNFPDAIIDNAGT
jgi:hypothetical protein